MDSSATEGSHPASIDSVLSVCTWNVLADCYSHGLQSVPADSYSERLHWGRRKDRIRDRILEFKTDIVCLQEVDHYLDFYQLFFHEMGYESIYVQRPDKSDGCCLAYNASKFILQRSQLINFDDICHSIANSQIAEMYLKHNVAQIAEFRWKKRCVSSASLQCESLPSNDISQLPFVVANCHIYWNPAKDEVKLAQSRFLKENLVFWLSLFML